MRLHLGLCLRILQCAMLLALALQVLAAAAAPPVVVGSKRFTESYVLGEITRLQLQQAGVAAVHRQGLGNTGILEKALASGAVDVYPEYTGTIVRELLKREGNPTLDELNLWLAPRGLQAAVPLGFNNTYGLALREEQAQRLGLRSISDLVRLPAGALKLGLSHEFQARADGWPALRRAYQLPQAAGSALDHGLAYEALQAGQVDLIDVYSTDAKVGRHGLRVLVDDRKFFPRYDAVLLMRAAVAPQVLPAVEPLAGRINEAAMTAMNAQVELDGAAFAQVAQRFLSAAVVAPSAAASSASTSSFSSPPVTAADALATRQSFMARLFAPDLLRLTLQHLALVLGSLLMALLVGVPLGIWAWKRPRLAAWVLGGVGMLQTIPSLALLAFLIALLGSIGFVPALLALALYALLPIVRNTHAGLTAVPAGLSMAGTALGLRPKQLLWSVQLALARPTLMAGVKTAAVINVGTATMAAFIGAGGLGERIVAGLAVNDTATMLAGALPAAVLALAVQWVFDRLERWVAPTPPGA